MEESNHEIINLLTHQIGTVFNPFMQDTNRSYQAFATQMERIANLFTPPQPVQQPVPQVQNPQPLRLIQPMVQRLQIVPQPQLVARFKLLTIARFKLSPMIEKLQYL
jgi:hypothetical protein